MPCDHGNIDSKRNGDFRSKQSRASEFHPAEFWMADMQLNRRFGEGKVRGEKTALLRLRHFFRKQIQEAKERAEVDCLAEHDPFYLEKIRRMCRIDLVVTKAARDRKILSRYQRCRRQGARGHGRALAAKHEPLRAFAIVSVSPSGGAGIPAVLVRCDDAVQKWIRVRPRMRRLFDEIDVVNRACRVELGHIQAVHIPELGLDERSSHFLKAHVV